MSQAKAPPVEIDPSEYADATDETRYVRFAEEVLGLTVTDPQKRVLEALATHQRVFVQSGNGVGKSFIAGVANLAFLFGNPDSTNMATSGTYSVLSDVLWKPMRRLFKQAQRDYGLPGRPLENPPRLNVDDEWYFKAVSPTYPDNLEGRHAGTMLVTIEEVDKPDITPEHFDSAGSMLTDDTDRFLAIANPPRDETNVAYQKAESDRWHTIQFSSFESHNVRVDAGELDAEKIPGLVDLKTVREDWENWNNEPWPGYETAKHAHENRDDLDERWYRRRAGVMPPAGASAYRPFYLSDVGMAVDAIPRTPDAHETPRGVGIDVARKGGDKTVVCRLFADHARFDVWGQQDHNDNESDIRDVLARSQDTPPTAVDAVGEGSGLADRLQQAYPGVHRFKNGSKPDTDDGESEYYDKWTEGLAALGDCFDGLSIDQSGETQIREELFTAARVVEFEEKRRRSGDVLRASPKSDVAERLGHSPDSLDALVMAAWVANDATHIHRKPVDDDRFARGF